MFLSLPEGCGHINWSKNKQFATWTANNGEEAVRRNELEAQGLRMVGDPHLCQSQDSVELWAVALE